MPHVSSGGGGSEGAVGQEALVFQDHSVEDSEIYLPSMTFLSHTKPVVAIEKPTWAVVSLAA